MSTCTCCRAEVTSPQDHDALCAACLLRLGLELDVPNDDIVIGREAHRVLGPIGRGPNGTVYLGCRVRHPPRFITVKVIEQPVEVEAFLPLMHDLRERLPRAGTCPAGRLIEASLTNEGRARVCAEYAPGPAVDQYFPAHGPSRDRLEVLVRICEELAELHECGLAHGSIKPQNIIVVASAKEHVPALLDAGVRPTIEASWRSRRVSRGAELPAVVFSEHARRADLDALDRLLCGLLETRPDVAAVCGQMQSNTREAPWQSAAELATHLKWALGQMQGV